MGVTVKRTLRAPGAGARVLTKTTAGDVGLAFQLGAREATVTQLRVLAEELRQIVVDRAYAGKPQAPGERALASPGWFRRRDIKGLARTPRRYWPLTRAHVLRKRFLGLDGRFLIAKGDYLKGIEVVRGAGKNPSWIVRLQRRKHKSTMGSSPIALSALAAVLEFGSHRWKIPPRPHWRPATLDIAARFRRLPRTVRAEALRASLRRVK